MPSLSVLSEGSGPRLVLIHGFTQTMASFDGIVPTLARYNEVLRVDLPGHGRSSSIELGFGETAGAIATACGEAAYLGYSLGGRLCLRLALDYPQLVRCLVLVSASPGIEDRSERATRRAADEALAKSIENDGIDAFLTRWLAQPLFLGIPEDAPGLSQRKANSAAGLASSLRTAGTAEMEPEWDRLSQLSMPVLLVAGERDEKFAAIASQMAVRIGSNAQLCIVKDGGHAVHLEAPERFVAPVKEFVLAHGSSTR